MVHPHPIIPFWRRRRRGYYNPYGPNWFGYRQWWPYQQPDVYIDRRTQVVDDDSDDEPEQAVAGPVMMFAGLGALLLIVLLVVMLLMRRQ